MNQRLIAEENERADREDFLESEEDPLTISVNNLDKFFQVLYSYYAEKGFWAMIVARIVNILIIAFTMAFSTWLFLFVNWSELLKCTTEQACKDIDGFRNLNDFTFWDLVIVCYFLFFCVYLFWNLLVLAYSWVEIREVSAFYNKTLKISDTELGVTAWYQVVDRLIELQDSVRLCHGHKLNALDITNRIMRKDNYLLAMVNANVIDFSSPCAGISDTYSLMHAFEPLGTHEVKPYVGKLLEWNIRSCILDQMFDDNFEIRREFRDPNLLKQRFIKFGVVNLCVMPFALIFRCIFFFLNYGEQLQTKNAETFSLREWTPYARLQLREFNELPHEFNQRIALTHEPAGDYLAHCEWVLSSIIGRFLQFVSGSIVGVLILVTMFDSNVLLYFELWGRHLVWYLAVFSAILAISRSLIKDNAPKTKDAKEAITVLLGFAHYLPKRWVENAHTQAVQQEFQSLYQSKIMVVFHEIVNVIFTPFIMIFSLPDCADDIVKFVTENSENVAGIGDVCKFSLLKLEEGDALYQSQVRDPEKDGFTDAVPPQYNASAGDTPLKSGKLEKSMVTFAMNHPTWQTDPLQADLLRSVVEDEVEQMKAERSLLVGQSRFGMHDNADDVPMNMSFSTLLGTFKQRVNQPEQDSWMDDDFQGINLLESTRAPSARLHARHMLKTHSRLFTNLERSSTTSKVEIRTHPMNLETIEEVEKEREADSPEVVVKPPLHHQPLPSEPAKRDPSLVYRPPTSQVQPLLKVEEEHALLGLEQIEPFPDNDLREDDDLFIQPNPYDPSLSDDETLLPKAI